jgi:glycosyltransferase involved in cell wall biosynthesis
VPHLKIIYHEHDAPDEKEVSIFIRALLITRLKLAQRADICILPNEQRARHFAVTLSLKKFPMIVWNCPRQDEVGDHNKVNDAEDFSAWYHGTIVPQRVPLSLLDAIAELPSQLSLHIIGYSTIGHANYVNELRKRVDQLGIIDRVIISDPLPRHLLLQECQKHTVGISFMPPLSDDINMQHMVGASNKAFDYMACGLALLVSDLPEWHDLYVKPEYGLACNPREPESIAAALRWFWENPDEREQMGQRGQARILSGWNYERQFSPVFKQMNL